MTKLLSCGQLREVQFGNERSEYPELTRLSKRTVTAWVSKINNFVMQIINK